jgi:hypothetical protein
LGLVFFGIIFSGATCFGFVFSGVIFLGVIFLEEFFLGVIFLGVIFLEEFFLGEIRLAAVGLAFERMGRWCPKLAWIDKDPQTARSGETYKCQSAAGFEYDGVRKTG